MASFNFKKYLPHILVVVAFAVVSLIYSYPALQGKVLQSGDNTQWQGMAHEALDWHKRTGQDVLWTNSMFGGMPTYTIALPDQNNYVWQVQNAIMTVLTKPAYFLFIAMLCFYSLMLVLKVNRWLGAAGAFAFAFSTFNLVLIVAGHDTELFAIAYMPAIIAGFILIYRGRYWGGAALMGLALALQTSNTHYQISYYTMIVLGFAFIGMLIDAAKTKKLKQFAIASVVTILTGLVAVGPTMAAILSTKEYQKVTMRAGKSELTNSHDPNKKRGGLDKDYAFDWSNGIGETFVALVPYLYGGSSGEPADAAPATNEALRNQYERLPLYWGPQDRGISGPVYYGAVICFLFVLGLMIIKSPHKWWMMAVTILAFMMSWGKNLAAFNYWLFDHLPLLNNFRTPSMILAIPEVIFPIIAIWAVQDIIMESGNEEKKKELWNKVKLAAGITAGLALLLGVGGSMFFSFTNPNGADKQFPAELLSALKEDRIAMARMSGIKSAVYILAAAGLIWAFLKNKASKTVMIAGLAVVFAIDLLPVALRYVNEAVYTEKEETKEPFKPTPADLQILQDKDPYYRVLDLSSDPYNDARQAYFHKVIGGYHPAKMEIYQDLIANQLNGQSGFNAQVLNMLNTKYIITPAEQNAPPRVVPNPQACGNAWFVNNIKWVNTADEEMASLNAGRIGDTAAEPTGAFRPKETAIIRNTFKQGNENFTPGKDSNAYVKLAKYGLDEISYTSSNSKEGLAVFSDIWYPYGWKAYIDNKEVPILKSDYVLRALRIPAGNHNIVFKFHPKSYYTGNTIAMITSLIIIALVLAALYKAWQDQKKEDRPTV